jgi:hypothetical protein
MRDEAGFSTESVIWQATCILLSCDAIDMRNANPSHQR